MTTNGWGRSGRVLRRLTPVAVVVDHQDARRDGQRGQIADAGWDVRGCSGPEVCPLLEIGEPCVLSAAAEVVVLAADHPRFAELHDAYRRLHPSVGLVVSFSSGKGPTGEQVKTEDAIGIVDDAPSLAYACAGARRRALERRVPW